MVTELVQFPTWILQAFSQFSFFSVAFGELSTSSFWKLYCIAKKHLRTSSVTGSVCRLLSSVSYLSKSALVHSPLVNFVVTSHEISSPPLTKEPAVIVG